VQAQPLKVLVPPSEWRQPGPKQGRISVKANATAFPHWRSWLRGGGFEPPIFGLCDLTHLSMRVGLYLHPRGMLAIQSLRLPRPFQGLGSVLPYARAT
jgi:hypothetical protein